MDSTRDLPLEETRLWLSDYAHRRFAPIPGELIASHIIKVTAGADFPVRRAAIEALHRRMQNVESDGLFVKETPTHAVLGAYVIAKAATKTGDVSGRKRHEPRPYETVLLSVSPLRGQCNCPDFLKGSLGLCKHLLTAIVQVYDRPKRLDAAQREAAKHAQTALEQLVWDPVIPLTGSGDRLLGLQLAGGGKLKGFSREGRVELSQLGDATLRMAFLRSLSERVQMRAGGHASVTAGPDVRALVAAEIDAAERRNAAQREGRLALTHLKGLKRKLYPYQLEGVGRFFDQGRLLLADDMGLGKTTQAIACCHALYHAGKVKRGLIITPASLKPQWLREWPGLLIIPRATQNSTLGARTSAHMANFMSTGACLRWAQQDDPFWNTWTPLAVVWSWLVYLF